MWKKRDVPTRAVLPWRARELRNIRQARFYDLVYT
jgi:hypothetical protein